MATDIVGRQTIVEVLLPVKVDVRAVGNWGKEREILCGLAWAQNISGKNNAISLANGSSTRTHAMSPSPPMADHAYGVDSLTTSDDGQSPLSSPDAAQDREATELHEYNNINSTVELNGSAIRSNQGRSALKTFWNRHVVATVPHEACRDHFGTSSLHRPACFDSSFGKGGSPSEISCLVRPLVHD